MAEVTRSPRVGALALLFITTISSQASTLHAQVSEPEKERPENPEQPAAGAEGVPVQADRATGFPTGYWIEFDDTKDWLRLTSGEWLRGDLNWMRNGDFEFDGDKTGLISVQALSRASCCSNEQP